MSGEIPPCIQIPQPTRYMCDVRLINIKQLICCIVGMISLVMICVMGIIIAAAVFSLFSIAYLIVGVMTVCMFTMIAILVFSYSIIRVPSDAHVCDLRIAAARKLRVDPLNLELGVFFIVYAKTLKRYLADPILPYSSTWCRRIEQEESLLSCILKSFI